MKEEKNLRWYFGPEGGTTIGPNDAVRQNFKGNPYYYIVRESIQNSLDAKLDSKVPVEVTFDFIKLRKSEFPKLFEIEETIERCNSFFSNNRHAERLFSGMKKFLNKKINGKSLTQIPCLRISDKNTKGMSYSDNTESPFFSFMRAQGISSKQGDSSGGSFGFGKGAYFNLSAINTVLASTLTQDGNYYFEGTTRLTTHQDTNGERKAAFGYYNNGNNEPVKEPSEIPDIFLKETPGTDFIIVGRMEQELEIEPMIKSVLNNFWLAIHKEKLIVKVNNTVINKDTLDKCINDYFDKEIDNSSVNDFENWNPKSYYKAVQYVGKNDKFLKFSENLNELGSVDFYVYRNDALSNKTCYIRTPNMVVYKETNNKLNGYSGVFVCEDPNGDKILMEMENPAHNEWNKTNYLTYDYKIHPKAQKAIREINSFINKCLEKLANDEIGSSATVLGLEEYLYIPEDLIAKDDIKGEIMNNNSGQLSIDLSEEETGALTNSLNKSPIKTLRKEAPKKVKQRENFELDENGNEDITTGVNEEGGKKQGKPHPNMGDQILTGEKGTEKSNRLISLRYRVVTQVEDGKLYHYLLINSRNEINDVTLDIVVGGDQDSNQDNVKIVYTNLGSLDNYSIKKLQIVEGLNKIKIEFEDSIKHSIGIKAYEVR